MDISLARLALTLSLSGGIGLLTGVFGVGGGFLLTPALIILLQVPGATAVGTGLLAIFCTTSLGLIQRRHSGTVDLKLAALLGAASLGGVVLGQRLMMRLHALPPLTVLGRPQPALDYVLMWAFVVMLAGVAAYFAVDYRRTDGTPQPRRGHLARWSVWPHVSFASLDHPRLSVTLLLVLGVSIGLLTGLMGIAGGVLWVPALIYLVGQRTAKATGTSLLLAWLAALGGAALNLRDGNVNFALLAPLVAGGLIGTHFGTHFGLTTSGRTLRFYFIFVLLGAMALIAARLAWMTLAGPRS